MTKLLMIRMGLAIALAPVCGFAVDGQILINQSTVMAAGGFPYTISSPGSYKLTGNLVVPVGSNAINISASNVTLDLNGFSITSTNVTVGAIGVLGVSAPTGITVRNGRIRGFEFPVGPDGPSTSGHWKIWTLRYFPEDPVRYWEPTPGFGTSPD